MMICSVLILTCCYVGTAPSGEPDSSLNPERFGVDWIPLHWKPISQEEANGIVLGYRISYQLISLGEEPVEEAPVLVLRVPGASYTLTNLEMYGKYKIGISAYTEKGDGPEIVMFGGKFSADKKYEKCKHHAKMIKSGKEEGQREQLE